MQILRPKDLAERLSISRTTLWRLQKEADFPQKVGVTERCKGWYLSEIEQWLNQKNNKTINLKTNQYGKIFALDSNLYVVRNNKINVDSNFIAGFKKVRIWETDYWSQFENVFDIPNKGTYHIDENYPCKLKLKYDESIGVKRFYFNKNELIINTNIFYLFTNCK